MLRGNPKTPGVAPQVNFWLVRMEKAKAMRSTLAEELRRLWLSLRPRVQLLLLRLRGLEERFYSGQPIGFDEVRRLAQELLEVISEADRIHVIICREYYALLEECLSPETLALLTEACMDYENIHYGVVPVLRQIVDGFIQPVEAVKYLTALRGVVKSALDLFEKILPGVHSCLEKAARNSKPT